MDKSLIYAIGEAILLEAYGVKNVVYPTGAEIPNAFIVESEDGQRYRLELKIV